MPKDHFTLPIIQRLAAAKARRGWPGHVDMPDRPAINLCRLQQVGGMSRVRQQPQPVGDTARRYQHIIGTASPPPTAFPQNTLRRDNRRSDSTALDRRLSSYLAAIHPAMAPLEENQTSRVSTSGYRRPAPMRMPAAQLVRNIPVFHAVDRPAGTAQAMSVLDGPPLWPRP
ncbi:hypothetical protein SMQC20_12200 [Serratia marcescens]|nr:hypothetical protein SMQC20_12200 [Serratia marcescens]